MNVVARDDVLDEDRELVSPDPPYELACRHGLFQSACERHQHPVGDVMPEMLVQRPHVVDVDEQHSERLPGASGTH